MRAVAVAGLEMTAALSVVIPTRNRAGMVRGCLASLVAQTASVGTFEVIVVDNGSTDATPEVVRDFAEKLPLRRVEERNPGLHAARHAGMKHAEFENLVFCDDDVIADQVWLQSISEAFRDDDVVLVGGNNRPLFDTPVPGWLKRWWDRPFAGGRAMSYLSILDLGEGVFDIDPGLIWGCNFAMRKAFLTEVGGFHPDALPNEMLRYRGDGETAVSDAVRRSGYRARFHSGASVMHRVTAERMTVEYFRSRSEAQGISDSYTDLRRCGGQCPWWVSRKRWARAHLVGLKARMHAGSDATGRALRGVRQRCLKSYLAGYRWHQAEVASDAALRDWVMRESYL